MFTLPSFLLLIGSSFNLGGKFPTCKSRLLLGGRYVSPFYSIAFAFLISSTLFAANSRKENDGIRADSVIKGAKIEPFFDADVIVRMMTEIDQRKTGGKLDVAIGSFNYENTDLQSSFSPILEKQMEVALARSGKVNVISKRGVADLQNHGGLGVSKILEPGIHNESLDGVQAILRGRFYPTAEGVKVDAELAWLAGGEIKKTRLDIPSEKLIGKLGNATSAAKSDFVGAIRPENVQPSLDNVKQIVTDRFEKIPRDFPVEIFTVDGKRAYVAGETIRFRVRSAEDCHITVICHQSDGRSVVLFPNRWCRDTLIHANETKEIPGTANEFQMKIGPPFGSDVVEVIACSQDSELPKKFAPNPPTLDKQHPFQVVTRGIIVEGIDSVLAEKKSNNSCRWGQDYMIVSTFP